MDRKEVLEKIKEWLDNNSEEGENTKYTMEIGKIAFKKGYLLKGQFLLFAEWKLYTGRFKEPNLRKCDKNSYDKIKTITGKALNIIKKSNPKDDLTQVKEAIDILDDELEGVGVPVASSVLTLMCPERFGVIDTLQLPKIFDKFDRELFQNYKNIEKWFTRCNKEEKKNKYCTVEEYIEYLDFIRGLAEDLNKNTRDVERALFELAKNP